MAGTSLSLHCRGCNISNTDPAAAVYSTRAGTEISLAQYNSARKLLLRHAYPGALLYTAKEGVVS